MLLPPPRPRTRVGPEVAAPRRRQASAARSDGSGSPPEKTSTATPASLSGRVDRLDQAGLEQHRVGDDEGPADAEAAGDLAEAGRGVAAEDQLPGGVEGPGGAHEGLRREKPGDDQGACRYCPCGRADGQRRR